MNNKTLLKQAATLMGAVAGAYEGNKHNKTLEGTGRGALTGLGTDIGSLAGLVTGIEGFKGVDRGLEAKQHQAGRVERKIQTKLQPYDDLTNFMKSKGLNTAPVEAELKGGMDRILGRLGKVQGMGRKIEGKGKMMLGARIAAPFAGAALGGYGMNKLQGRASWDQPGVVETLKDWWTKHTA